MKNTKNDRTAKNAGAGSEKKTNVFCQFFIDILQYCFIFVGETIEFAKDVICNMGVAYMEFGTVRILPGEENRKLLNAWRETLTTQEYRMIEYCQSIIDNYENGEDGENSLLVEYCQSLIDRERTHEELNTQYNNIYNNLASGYNVLCYIASYVVRKFILARTARLTEYFDEKTKQYKIKRSGFLPVDYYLASRIQYEKLVNMKNRSREQEFILDLQSECIAIIFQSYANGDGENAINNCFKQLHVDRDEWRSGRNKTVKNEFPVNDMILCMQLFDLVGANKNALSRIEKYNVWNEYNSEFSQECLRLFYETTSKHKIDFTTYYYIMRDFETKKIAEKYGLTSSNISQKKAKYIFYLYDEYFSNPEKYVELKKYGVLDETYIPAEWVTKKINAPAWVSDHKKQRQEKTDGEKIKYELQLQNAERERIAREQANEKKHIDYLKTHKILTVEEAVQERREHEKREHEKREREQDEKIKRIKELQLRKDIRT